MMKPMFPGRAWLLLFFFAFARTLPADTPPRPVDGLLDEAIVFNASQAAAIKSQIKETLERDGVAVYVTTMTFISGGGVRERGMELMRAWLADAPGVVLAYNRGEGQPALTLSPGFWGRYPADEVAQLLQDSIPILLQASVTPDVKLLAAMTHVRQATADMEARRQARSTLFRPEDQRLALILAGALLGLGALVWMIARSVQKHSAARKRRHYFPEAEVGLRLGAPHGGGTMVEARATQKIVK